jgi:hypothetical protein
VLAPVLARLLRAPAVTGASVECTGTYFLVNASSAEALERAVPAIRDVLGPTMHRVEGAAREAQLAHRSRGEMWFSTGDIRALSYVEGRILATRMGDAVTASVPLELHVAEQVVEATRAEIFAALDEAHDSGGRSSTHWFWGEWPSIVARIAARLERDVPPDQCSAIRGALHAQGQRSSHARVNV